MSAKALLFSIVVATEALQLGGLVVSIVRPRWRTWPPSHPGAWQLWWSWGLLGIAVAGSLALAWLDRGTFLFDHWTWKAAAVALFALAEVFNEWSVRTIGRRASRGLGGDLVTEGPYAVSRNPQYVAQSAMVVAIVLFANSTLVAIAGILGIACLLLTPLAEEKWLEERHGEAYHAYRRRVPRFLGPPRREGGTAPDGT